VEKLHTVYLKLYTLATGLYNSLYYRTSRDTCTRLQCFSQHWQVNV